MVSCNSSVAAAKKMSRTASKRNTKSTKSVNKSKKK